jgi:protein SCO1/2
MGSWELKIVSMHRIAFSWSKLFFLVLTFTSCQESVERLPYFNTPDFTPVFLDNDAAVKEQIDHSISAFEFTNHLDQKITNQDIEGRIHIADFMFTRCGSICPKMTNNMKLVSEAFISDEDVMILSYSVTPWADSVERLNDYVINKEIKNPNWYFLTGNKSDIYNLARQSYFAEEDIGYTRDSTEFLHTEHFILVDQNQRIRGIYNGTLLVDVKQLIKDIKRLKSE